MSAPAPVSTPAPSAASSSGEPYSAGKGSSWNVNQWHWEEKNWNEWAKQAVKEALASISVDIDGGVLTVADGTSVTGEAFVNIRKGKKRHGFRLESTVRFNGSIKDGEGNVVSKSTGSIKVEINNDCGDDINDIVELGEATVDGKTPVDQKVLADAKTKLVAAIKQKIAAWMVEFKEK